MKSTRKGAVLAGMVASMFLFGCPEGPGGNEQAGNQEQTITETDGSTKEEVKEVVKEQAPAKEEVKEAVKEQGKVVYVKCTGDKVVEKGQSDCGGHGNDNGCSGQNECKGKGWKKMTKEDCEKAGGTAAEEIK